MRPLGRDSHGQMQLLESIMVALFIFIAIAVVSVHRLPTHPGAFAEAELQVAATDIMKVRQAKVPKSTDDCNEAPCPFKSDLVRLISLAMGYVGPTPPTEVPAPDPLEDFLRESLPAGAGFVVSYSNGYNVTNLAPVGLSPPAGPVVVARTVIEPNWTVFATYANSSVSLRVQDITNFGSPSAIVDALGRIRTEGGVLWNTTLDNQKRVPYNATYGTYRLCYGNCTSFAYFNVVPIGSVGVGSKVLPNDPGLSGTLRYWAAWKDAAKYENVGVPGSRLYLNKSLAAGGTVAPGDIRLFRLYPCRTVVLTNYDCGPGSLVRTGDLDEGRAIEQTDARVKDLWFRDVNGNTAYDESDTVYLNMDTSPEVNDNDIRISRAGVYETGSTVNAGDQDNGTGFSAAKFNASSSIVFLDRNGNTILEEGEPIFLNLTWDDPSATLGASDLHLSPVNLPTARYFYDVRLAVWYGV